MAPQALFTNGVGLTDDLLLEILTKLPLKCIHRSKCISRSWRQLISDRYAAAKLPLIVSGVFYRWSVSEGSGLEMSPKYGCNSNGSFCEADLSYLPFHHDSTIIDCCNGLLLFYRSIPSAFHVCNPTTRRWAALPKPRNRSQLSVLAFDACKSPHYKVVCFIGWMAQGGRLEVFSSETGLWAEHRLNWGVDTDRLSASMHYSGGVLHVLAHPQHLVSIDLEKMSCSVIELPEDMNHDACLGNSGGALHCAMNDANEFRVWILKGARWVLKNRFSVAKAFEWGGGGGAGGVVSSGVLDRGNFNILAFHPSEEVVYIRVKGDLVSYDLREKKFGMVWKMGEGKEKLQLIQIWLFPFSDNLSECLA